MTKVDIDAKKSAIEESIKNLKNEKSELGWKFWFSSELRSVYYDAVSEAQDEKNNLDRIIKENPISNHPKDANIEVVNQAIENCENAIDECSNRIDYYSGWKYWLFGVPGPATVVLTILVTILTYGSCTRAPTAEDIAIENANKLGPLLGARRGVEIQDKIQGESTRTLVRFDAGDSKPSAGVEELETLVRRYWNRNEICAVVVSYADDSGDKKENRKLLDARLRSVAGVLESFRNVSTIQRRGGVLDSTSFSQETLKNNKDRVQDWKTWARRADVEIFDSPCDSVRASPLIPPSVTGK